MEEDTKTLYGSRRWRRRDMMTATYPCLCEAELFLLITHLSIFCLYAKAVLRNLERSHRAHFEMWFQGWLAFYDCMFMT